MTVENILQTKTKHTDDQTVDYWEWWRLSTAEKEYFTANHDYIGSRPTIIALNSWKDLPIPSIQSNDLKPQQQALDNWTGISHLGRSNSFRLNSWLTLFFKRGVD